MVYKHPEYTPEQLTERYMAAKELNNIMNLHCLYYARRQQQESLEQLWSKKAPDPHFAQNDGYFTGLDVLKKTFGRYETDRKVESDRLMNKLEPEFIGKPDKMKYGTETLNEPTLSTPLIEIAGDGKTAKGLWQVFAQITVVGPKGAVGLWGFGKYGVDFVFEDGKWKIWHMMVCTDFCNPAGQKLDSIYARQLFPAGLGIGIEPPIKAKVYDWYYGTKCPQNVPAMPEPYYTFCDTFSY